jgi:hypothetical protein
MSQNFSVLQQYKAEILELYYFSGGFCVDVATLRLSQEPQLHIFATD